MRLHNVSERILGLIILSVYMVCYSGNKVDTLFFSHLPIIDTLDVYSGEKSAGILISMLTINNGHIENSIKISVDVDEPYEGNKLRLYMNELRRYDIEGEIIEAREDMMSASGVNSWLLTINNKKWKLTVQTAGVSNTREVEPVGENISTLLSLYKNLLEGDIKIGMLWTDTSIELTSGKPVVSEILCIEIPSRKNNNCWVFQCFNTALQQKEIWMVDRHGKTIYREMFPYVVCKRGTLPRNIHKKNSFAVPIFEITKIKVPRPPDYTNEIVVVSFENNQQMDTSVMSFFRSDGKKYILNPMPDKCTYTETKTLNKQFNDYLKATPTLQADHPRIKRLADSLRTGAGSSACELIEKYNSFVYSFLRKQNSATFSSALETLEAGYGDCGEHAVLLAALLRASDIPARVVAGLLYVKQMQGYMYHAWVMSYSGEWIFADPSHDCFPAYQDRIPLLVDDDGTRLIELAKVIGRINISYIKK